MRRQLTALGLTAMLTAGTLTVPLTASAVPHLPRKAVASGKVSSKALLRQLATKSETPSGYKRSKFKLWTDRDHDGCNTRAEVLIVEAKKKPKKSASCKLTGGKWTSPYDGKTFTNTTKLDIDHMVPLNEAWQSGAKRWTAATRTAYANDLGYAADLIAVSAHSNRSKGDKEPQNWMPSRASYRCTYVANWVAVKWRWHLAVNGAERKYLSKKLSACHWPTVKKPSRPKIHTSSTGGGGSSGGGTSAKKYANCTAMHGDYPHGVGLPGAVDSTSGTPVTNFYVSAKLYNANKVSDRDHDNIACEA